MAMSLKRIEIEGFKSIRKMDELKLRPLNILIGANGAGKSNFISVFQFLNQIVNENLQNFVRASGGAEALLYFGQKVTTEIVINLDFGRNGYEVKLTPTTTDNLFFAKERCWYYFESQYSSEPYHQHFVELGQGHEETRLLEEARKYPDKIASYVLKHLKSWTIYHFHDTSGSAKLKLTGDINDNATLKSDASNLAAFLYLLREKHWGHYDKIVKTIRLAAPFFDDFILRPSPLNPEKIQLEWREKGSDAYFNVNSLSDGTLRFICLTTLLLQPKSMLPSTILIDEPELGLHPHALILLAGLLQSAATKTQVIVSTQSVPLVNQFSPEDIIVVDREDGQSVFKSQTIEGLESWLEEYGLGDLWEKSLIGGTP
jgi:predicted ATPase